ncbi:Protein CBR-STR-173 [Caenorhabditis briggsae]|uniref:Serpentine receptor class r-10 n=1 Tax=Caenorhabditis briggsae TaxID=6238 RepID=A8XDS2_CAEBR|nr:Protein CBR-STR-173 [Caenorhabditis briggsae]CAP30792.2 Protein CBR-STR-173 [Caenorhabditis briggsae]
MQIETFANVKTTIQICSVILSAFVNTVSIYLIITESPKIMGTYRHLMTYFCCCSLLFSLIDAVVQPNIQTYKSAFFMVVDVKSRHLTPSVAEFFIDLLCGFIAVTVYGIAIHFIYRFLALERQGRLRYFNHQFLLVWLSIPLIAGTIWFIVTGTVFSMDPITTEYIRSTVKEFFNLDMEDVVYGAAAFFPLDQNGQKFTSYLAFFGLSCYLTLLTIPFLTMLICGLKSWKKVRCLLDHGESEFARNLQMQLYKALIAQTVLPVVFFYIPFGFIFILPIFEIDCQFMAAPVTLVFAIYPALDPLPTLFFVDYYRNAIWGNFGAKNLNCLNFSEVFQCKKARIEGTVDESVSRNIQTYKSAFFMVVDVKDRHLTPWVAELSIRMLCGCIGVTTYGMAIHFVYRFFALEREGRLRFFNQKFLFLWFSIPLFGGVLWFLVTEFTFPMNKETTEYIRSTVKEFFNLDMEDVVYGAAAFFPLDQNGQKFTSYLAFFGLSCYLTLLTIPFLTMLICGLKSWKKVRCLLDHGESEFARNLQMQLYKALIAQTVLPVVFFYIPFGFIFIFPIFEINCQFIAAPITLVFAMYSAIDALPTLFFVDYYRKAIIGLKGVWVTVPTNFRCVGLVSV